jgi:hypothetical protein
MSHYKNPISITEPDDESGIDETIADMYADLDNNP